MGSERLFCRFVLAKSGEPWTSSRMKGYVSLPRQVYGLIVMPNACGR
jgi:hypothetical protein